ncbi:cytochrome P450 704C1-like [Phragmites australis]|uniref:cytochrome P450 704C1-like n=1 Tax=Phragmites australis TaxID=29695 RepID=UPI002D796BBB|nr:cytochrome P450 704C1-like [Phragmites australis]
MSCAHLPADHTQARTAAAHLAPRDQCSRPGMDSPLSRPALLALSLLLLLALYFARRRRGGGKNRKYPPVAGTMFHQLLNFGRLAEYHTELSRRYRTFRMLTPTCNYVYTVEPANVEYILKTNFANYGKGVMTHDVLEDLLGDGIFNVDGAKWRHQRKVASLEFSTRMLRDYSSAVFRDTAAELAGIVAARAGERVDIQDLLMRSTLDSIFKVGFGVNLGALSGSSEKGAAFARAFDDASEQVLYRFFDLFWKAKKLLNVSSEAAMKRSVRTIDDFVYAVIDRKIELMRRDQQEFAKKEDILSRFLLERERDPGCFDNKYLRDIILNFVIAGRDTTAGTLSWFLYVLCRDQRVQDRIAREVRTATTGDRDVGAQEFAACLTEDAISKMQYLHAALTETLRLYPAVPIDVKYCFSDDTLPDGYAIKKGDMVNYQPYPMGRMMFLWGADAEEFRPERWLDDDGVFVPESPFKFTAFQAGPRICLGKEFAYRQMKIFAAVLLYSFRFQMWDDNATVGYRPMLTLKMDGPLYVRASLRS